MLKLNLNLKKKIAHHTHTHTHTHVCTYIGNDSLNEASFFLEIYKKEINTHQSV